MISNSSAAVTGRFRPEADLAIRLINLVGELIMFRRCADQCVPVHASGLMLEMRARWG